MAAAGPASDEEIASQLMMPQGIDLSSLGNLAAVLGVSQGLNLLVGQQKGIFMSRISLPDFRREVCSRIELSVQALSHKQLALSLI